MRLFRYGNLKKRAKLEKLSVFVWALISGDAACGVVQYLQQCLSFMLKLKIEGIKLQNLQDKEGRELPWKREISSGEKKYI